MPVKTDEKKQHFDEIYVSDTPVLYKTDILDKLDYVSDNFNRQAFDRLVLPWIQSDANKSRTLSFVDLCACFGNTTMATVHGMSYDQIRDNWKDTESCHTITAKRRFDCTVTAIDISPQAMAYGSKVGLFDKTFVADLNGCGASARAEVESAMTAADIFICAAALVYLDLDAIDQLVAAFAATDKEGYAMVNFLSFFAAEKTDETKKILLKHLDFVGSTASRHRRMSPLEQSNYPGEEWVLLEVWVLKRKASP